MNIIFNKHKKSQAGDTIVEVLIALTILGLALSIAYATASRSLTAIRLANETSNATAIAKSQVEQIRSAASLPSSTFCFSTANISEGDQITANIDTNPDCRLTLYKVKIIPSSGVDTGVYTVNITWDSSGGTYNLNMLYRK
ncbi:MAG: type II secretion system protein [bacterium]